MAAPGLYTPLGTSQRSKIQVQEINQIHHSVPSLSHHHVMRKIEIKLKERRPEVHSNLNLG
jgi:hypothetical protein